jgi:hypothetical protein
MNSYLFYKKIVDTYQDKLLKNIKVVVPSLVTKNSVEPTSTTAIDLTTYLNRIG